MSSSFGDVKAVLAEVAEQTRSACAHVGVARERLAAAEAVLAALSDQHDSSLVPPDLARAAAELERGLGLITRAAVAVADIDARL